MNIKRVQQELNTKGYGPLQVDGIAGAKTYAAVKEFQKDSGLTPDGFVGPMTLAKLFPVEQPQAKTLALRALEIARTKIGVRELTGNNDGPEVEAYLKCVGLGKGFSWCMAFVVYCFQEAAKQLGVKCPLIATGGCMDQWRHMLHAAGVVTIKNPQAGDARPGDIFIIDLGNDKGHTGIIEDYATVHGEAPTVEGNTNDNGSANGDGVYERSRVVAKLAGLIRC